MYPEEISTIRLFNQKIVKSEFHSAKELVTWMGAMQAQDYFMSQMAVGIRLMDSTDEVIDQAMKNGEIIRTHVMRPTWHLVSADDLHWMLELTAPHVISSLRRRHKELELNEAVLLKSRKVIEKALSSGINLTRDELAIEFAKVKIKTNENRLSHLLMYAELTGIICSGPPNGKKQTYALFENRVPVKNTLTRDQSLAELAKRYFTSHGPATIYDFAWWSGLTIKDARQGLELVKPNLVSETKNTKEYWFAGSSTPKDFDETNIHLLPAFDEFLISYKDRSASLMLTNNKHVVSNNGVFKPTVVINGQVEGTWKCIRTDEVITIEVSFMQPQNISIKNKAEEVADKLGDFLQKTTKICFRN